MSAPVLSRPLIARAGRRPPPPPLAGGGRGPAAAPRPHPRGSLPGGPQGAARREGRFPPRGVVAAPVPADAAPRGPGEGSPPPRLPGGPPRPRAGPRGPTLRANPFPEVTDPFCRLPLPTLFRWLEALHLGDLMRLWVRPGGNTIAVPRVFTGRWGASRTPRRLGRPASRPAPSPGEPIPGPSGRVPRRTRAAVREEREPSSGPPPASPGFLASPRRSVPRRRFGDLDPIPFRPRARPPSRPRGRGRGAWPPRRAARDRAPSERAHPMP